MREIIRSSLLLAAIILLRSGAVSAAWAQGTSQPPAPTTFLLNSTSDAAKSAFDAGYAAFLELDWARAADEFRRAFAADSTLRLARAFELTVRGRAPAVGDEIERLRVRNGPSGPIEGLMFLSLRELHHARTGTPVLLLDAAARSAPTDSRLLAHYHINLALGSANRVAVARALRDREPDSYRSHAYVALAVSAPADSAEALRAMSDALRLGRDRPFAHWVAGEVMTRMGRYDQAIEHYGHALDRDPGYYIAARDRAQTALYAGRYADARSDFQLVQERATYSVDRAVARRAEAITYLHEGDIDRAMSEMTRVAQLFESEGSGWRTQPALAYQQLAFMAAAKKDVSAIEHNLAQQRRILGEVGGVRAASGCGLVARRAARPRARGTV